MRSVLICLSLGVLAGCATVSVVPGQTTVETELSRSQSALRTSSDAYCDFVAEKGWAEADRGLAGFADLLLKGRKSDSKAGYASQIGADTRAPALVLARISADAEAARLGLQGVTTEARDVLSKLEAETSKRGDVMSYERALIRAQMAYRSFHEAFEAVSARADMDTAPIEADLAAFATSIDEARRVADQLADHYTGRQASAS